MKKHLYLFDFDGTITNADTLLHFIRYACGSWSMFCGFALHAPLLVLMKLHLYSNYRAKERLFGWFFRGMNVQFFDAICQSFATDNAHLLRPAAASKLRQLLDDGEQVCVVSASIDNWVRPFFTALASGSAVQPQVIGTQVEVDANGCLTGKFLTPNCYGAEKVNRINALLPDVQQHRAHYHIVAYGDSRGDREMLAIADESHYKPFR